jgi:hypothetical protein
MKPMIQPDRHPDAESLNAFVEHALHDPERARIVAHMAECARCRDVVYVAQSAAEAEAAPLAGFKAEPRPGWITLALAKWRVALIPAAALAATGAVALWVQLRPAPPRVEMARVAPQPSAQVTAPAAARTADRSIPPPAPGPASASGLSAADRSTEPEQRPEQEKSPPPVLDFPPLVFPAPRRWRATLRFQPRPRRLGRREWLAAITSMPILWPWRVSRPSQNNLTARRRRIPSRL